MNGFMHTIHTQAHQKETTIEFSCMTVLCWRCFFGFPINKLHGQIAETKGITNVLTEQTISLLEFR